MIRQAHSRPSRPELLESRDVPALFGQPWADPGTLSVSLVPDGTAVPGGASRLFAALSGVDVQAVVAEAVQAWAEHAGLDFHFVPDGGQPLGTPGAAQGDRRFGDIRIAGVDLAPEVLAITAPHDAFLSATFSGDILINTAATFDRDRLLHVLLHETGHSLGLGNSTDPLSVRFHTEHGGADLSASDIEAVQALYGVRHEPAGNDTFASATRLGRNDDEVTLKAGELGSRADADVYTFRPAGSAATVHLRASGLSLVRATLTVFDATGVVLATA
ncbi:MAG: matrixin family metalloprotease, partial [Gemmataceae bacterium]